MCLSHTKAHKKMGVFKVFEGLTVMSQTFFLTLNML
jgi:hypothetical protein